MGEPGEIRSAASRRRRQCREGAAVQLDLSRDGDGLLDREASELVAEGDAGRLGHERAGVQALVQAVDGIIGKRVDQPELGLLRDDRNGIEDRPTGVAEARCASQHCIADGVGDPLLGRRERLDDEERIARGPAPELLPIDVVRLGEQSDRCRRERADLEPVDARACRELAEHQPQRVPAVELVVAIARDYKHGDGLNAPAEEPKHVERGLIGPVDILEHKHARPAGPELADERRRQLVRQDAAGHHLLELAAGVFGNREQRPERTRGEERVAASPEHAGPVPHACAEVPQQRCLAGARIAAHQDEPAGCFARRALQAGRKRGQLAVSLQQLARNVR
jgi:hypothetical protein